MTEKLTVNLAGNIVPERIGDISVLLIDNDTTSIEFLTSMLKQFSYKVMSLNKASEALSMIEKQKDTGLVIANIEMPHIDSHSFLTALLHKKIPLILISPEINTKETSDLLTKSARFCLTKPISENDIENLWQHVVPKKSQELKKINIAEQQEKVVEKNILNQIESLRETIKRQRTSQSSLLGRRPFVKTFTTPETYQKRKGKAIDEGKTKPVYPTEAENKREEGINMETISILGAKDSCPKSILSIMNDSDLNLCQVGSHLQKYKAQVKLMNHSLSRNEWRSTDKTFNYPSDYEYPFNASNLAKNIVENSFKKSAEKGKAKMVPKFHLGGKLDLSKHSLFGNLLNKSPMEVNYAPSATSNNPPSHIFSIHDVNHIILSSDNPPVLSGLLSSVGESNHSGLSDNPPVLSGLSSSVGASNHSGLSSDNPPVLYGLSSSVGASNTDAFQMESSGICIPQSEPNPFQPSSSVLEIDWNQLDLDFIYIPEPYVPQADLCIMGESYFLPDLDFTMNTLETNMDQISWSPSTDNIRDHETNINQIGCMDWIPTLENYVLPQTDMNINVPETNISSVEGYVASENMIPSEISNQMGMVSSGENHVLSQNVISHVGFASGQTSYETSSQTNTTTIFETNTDQIDWLHASFETNKTQSLETNMEDMALVPYVEDNDVPIEELIYFDIDVNEMDIDCWFEILALLRKIFFFRRVSTSQKHNVMEPCGKQNMEAGNPREAMEGEDHFDDDPECMS
ncbi:hypothetical protein EUTSA_v10019466mg [Eutrema salsugineum]|uniref:Response regulatory domain-containing protein n=1 Tax=Eutrema salsugineum TaxID=72664 RepID=V4KN65_EUTSA|nr:hypothetical protein EUTSA_v10019466mg [Eutrema salsugineum]